MIRMYTGSDLESIIKIWLDASLQGHDFIDGLQLIRDRRVT